MNDAQIQLFIQLIAAAPVYKFARKIDRLWLKNFWLGWKL